MMLNPVIKLTVFLLFLHSIAIAQSDTTYFDANWEKTSKEKASYFRPKPVKVDDDHYLVKDHYISNGQVQMEAISLDDTAGMLDGTTTWYYANGNLKEKANFKKGLGKGAYHVYASNGNLLYKSKYRGGLLEGDMEGYDTLNGKRLFSGEFLYGRRHGWFTWYYPDGITEKRAVKYSYGRVKRAYSYNKQGEVVPFDSVFTLAVFPYGYADINDYLDHNSIYRDFVDKHKRSRICFHVMVYYNGAGDIERWELENHNAKEYQDLVKGVLSDFPNIGTHINELQQVDGGYSERMHIRFRNITYSGY